MDSTPNLSERPPKPAKGKAKHQVADDRPPRFARQEPDFPERAPAIASFAIDELVSDIMEAGTATFVEDEERLGDLLRELREKTHQKLAGDVPITIVNLAVIRTDGGTQMRAELSKELFLEYRDAMLSGARFPAIDLFYDGTTYWLADGFHRFYGAREAGLKQIRARVHNGTVRDAILFAAGANAKNGLRRTAADKRNAINKLLADKDWRKKADRWIAEACGVGHQLVADCRRQLGESSSSEPRVGRDGKTRKLPTPKPDFVPPSPDNSDASKAFLDALKKIKNARSSMHTLASLAKLFGWSIVGAGEFIECCRNAGVKVFQKDDTNGKTFYAISYVEPVAVELAKEYGVTPEQIVHDGRFADAVDAIAATPDGEQAKAIILSGKSGLSQQQVIEIAALPDGQFFDALKRIVPPKVQPYTSLSSAIEALDSGLERIYERWPREYLAVFGEKLMSLAEEFQERGRLHGDQVALVKTEGVSQ